MVNNKTRQPVQGRKRGGGLKLGTMELDAIVAHGAMNIVREKFYDHSDGFSYFISDKTGFVAKGNYVDNIYESSGKISRVETPWMFHHVNNLVQSAGISMKIKTEC